MSILIYYFEDFNDSLHISNFEHFINYGIKNNKWCLPKRPITRIILFVNDKTKFYNEYNKSNLYNVFIEIITIETIFVDSINIIAQFYKYVETHPQVLTHNDPTIMYINSKLIGPILDPDIIESHWIDILIDKINTETQGVKHFTKNLLIFNYRHYQNRIVDLHKLTMLDIFIFRKNTIPLDFNYDIYRKYVNGKYLINSSTNTTKEYLIYHYLKYNSKTSYAEIKSFVENNKINMNKIKDTIEETCLQSSTQEESSTLISSTQEESSTLISSTQEESSTLISSNQVDDTILINNIVDINPTDFKDKTINIVNKETFREACLQQLPFICNVILPTISLNQTNETILIEFRWFEHLEFLLRNMMIKLPDWSHTVVCGNNNYEDMVCCCNKIGASIRIIKLDIENLTPSEYSALLLTPNFWNNFYGDKLLIYQEDSFLFHSKGIDSFMEYDYVGAPWNETQDDNSYGVGNGGFSLRSKSIMLEVINKVNPTSLIIGESTKAYIKNTNSYVLPEDVYFTKSMIDFQIGKLAPRNIAQQFSQECVKGKNPLGGHNFFLANNYTPEKINLGLIKRTNLVGLYSPYPYTLGGGEKYLADLMKFFIAKDYQIVFYNNTLLQTVIDTLKIYEIDIVVNKVQIRGANDLRLINMNNITYDYFIEMANSALPDVVQYIPRLSLGYQIAHKHIFHCQFPENIFYTDFNQPNYIDKVIVNSEFTDLFIKQMYNNSYILYPQCELKKSNDTNTVKTANSFITIGRLFPYTKSANNKNIDRIVETFIQLKHLDFTLSIVCSVKNKRYLQRLQELVNNHSLDNKIKFYCDVTDDEKVQLLNKSKYYIHATGIVHEKYELPHEEEHFGISPIEGIMSDCVLITADRGYPPYYINHSKNGFLYDSVYELQQIVLKICTQEIDQIEDVEVDKTRKYANETFGYNGYISTLTKILMNI
jgi:glycosyltransferase involved in cell wall biosynthesis